MLATWGFTWPRDARCLEGAPSSDHQNVEGTNFPGPNSKSMFTCVKHWADPCSVSAAEASGGCDPVARPLLPEYWNTFRKGWPIIRYTCAAGPTNQAEATTQRKTHALYPGRSALLSVSLFHAQEETFGCRLFSLPESVLYHAWQSKRWLWVVRWSWGAGKGNELTSGPDRKYLICLFNIYIYTYVSIG